jgi:DNA-binding transcriptional MerR regulator
MFTSGQAASIAGVSLRQLQWWDENALIMPRQEGHRRIYSGFDIIYVMIVAELRRKGLSLQRIRRIIKGLRKTALPKDGFLLIGHRAAIFQTKEQVIDAAKSSHGPVLLVSLADHFSKIPA